MAEFGKAHGLQLFVRLSYRGDRFFGVTPQREGPCVQEAVCERLRRSGCNERPYAINFAARTDRQVHALENWLSFRLRVSSANPTSKGAAIVAALERPHDDGLTVVAAQQVPRRVMARNCARAKHYRYLLPDAAAPSRAQTDGLLCELQLAAAALSGRVHLGRLAHPGAVQKPDAGLWRPTLVQVRRAQASGFVVDVFGAGFLRRQVRYLVGALQAVQSGAWSSQDVAHWTAGHIGPPRPGFLGPAEPAGLTLVSLLPQASVAHLLGPTLGHKIRDAAFASWLSGPGAP